MGTIDTTQGANGPFAAPAAGCSTPTHYRAAMRRRWANELGWRQVAACYARRLNPGPHWRRLQILGPFAQEAWAILTQLAPETDQAMSKAKDGLSNL